MDIEKRTLKGTENVVKEIMMGNVLELEKEVSIQTQETFRIPIRKEKNKQKQANNNKISRKEIPLIMW